MRKKHFLLIVWIFVFGCFLLAAESLLAEETTTYPFRGVTFTKRVVTSPYPLKTYIVKIDLTDPGISAFVTPSNGAAPCEVDARRTSEFADEFGTQIAINGSFFAWCAGGFNIRGLSASEGDLYSTDGEGFWLLNINAENWPSMALSVVPDDMYNALAGDYWLLVTSGVPSDTTGWPTGRNPRTAVGYTRNRQTLILCVVDGRQPGVSEGVTFDELIQIMLDAGAWDALNLDGGGSSTLVFNDGTPVVQNVPSDAEGERLVANHLGIYIDTNIEPWPWWGPVAFEDDFDDNYFDPAAWVEATGATLPGYVVEQNQRLEFHGRKYARPADDFSAYYKITGWALAGGAGPQGPEMSIKLRSDGGLLGWLGTPTGIKVSYWPEWNNRGAMHLQTNYDGELSTNVLLWPDGQTSPHDFKFEVVDTGEFVRLYIEDSADADNNCSLTLHGLDNPLYDYGDYIYIGAADGDIFYDDIVIQMPRTLSDFDGNKMVDLSDFAVMAAAWLSDPCDPRWNSVCDISDPPDDIIDLLDVFVFAEQWLWQAPPEP